MAERKILYTELLIDKGEFGRILPCFTGLMRVGLIGGGVLVCHLPPELELTLSGLTPFIVLTCNFIIIDNLGVGFNI